METDIVEELRDGMWWSGPDYPDDEGVDALMRQAADEIERLRVICASMDDPSRTSHFEYDLIDGVGKVRTVTYTAWRVDNLVQ